MAREPLFRSRHFRCCLSWIAIASICGASSQVAAAPPRQLVVSADITQISVLSQNWTDDEASWFYNVAQGSQLIPYKWFLALEQADSVKLFREESHIRSLGYLPRLPDSSGNPDGLPIGFTKDGTHLGLTCASCHTNQINFQGKAWLIDGAPTLADFEEFQRRLLAALDATSTDTTKFDRFAASVLGAAASAASKADLKQELNKARAFRKGYADRNLPRTPVVHFGPGRVDAFGAIMNEVTSTFSQLPNNHAPANAPVSYPFLWDTPQHDKVQWNGAAENTVVPLLAPILGTSHIGALGRNAGEVLGVFGAVDASSAGLLGLSGYPSSVNKTNLIQIEETLRKLWSPQWPTQFGTINESDRLKGKQLFHDNCAKCHDDTFNRTSPDRHVEAKMDAVETDPLMAANFATRQAQTGILNGRLITLPGFRRFGPQSVVKEMLVHMVQRVVLGPTLANPASSALSAMAPQYVIHAEIQLEDNRRLTGAFSHLDVVEGKVREIRIRKGMVLKEISRIRSQEDKLLMHDEASFDRPGRFFANDAIDSDPGFDLASRANTHVLSSVAGTQVKFDQPVTVLYQYKGRPLNGIWATAPYLHNGSVPNLDELLKRPSQRVKKFNVGSREFDPDKIGFKNDGRFEFDTSLPGNSNAGHDYKRETDFSPEERKQLIEYMKSL